VESTLPLPPVPERRHPVQLLELAGEVEVGVADSAFEQGGEVGAAQARHGGEFGDAHVVVDVGAQVVGGAVGGEQRHQVPGGAGGGEEARGGGRAPSNARTR
jgi:hypothetical protein